MRVSVIIPNYNHARYLQARIDSILAQTYRDFEIIILDDCSTDNSREVIEQYRENEHVTQIVYSEQNSGSPFVQWNRGFRLAKGSLIWIAESDDTCEPTMLERLVNRIDSHPQVALAFCRTMLMNAESKKEHVFQAAFPQEYYEGNDFIRRQLIWGNCVVNASSAVFSREVALRVSDAYTHFHGVGDWLFWTELAELGGVVVDNEPLNNYRYYQGNTTSRNRLQGNEEREARSVFDYFSQHGHLSLPDSIRIRKKYIWHIKYEAGYKGSLRQDLLHVWGNNPLLSLLAWVSSKIQGRHS